MLARLIGVLIGLISIGIGAYALTLGVTGQAAGDPYPNTQHISPSPPKK